MMMNACLGSLTKVIVHFQTTEFSQVHKSLHSAMGIYTHSDSHPSACLPVVAHLQASSPNYTGLNACKIKGIEGKKRSCLLKNAKQFVQ